MIPNCKKKEDNFLNKYYPIGSIYMNINPVDPNKIWGGVWERIEDVFLIGCSETYNAGIIGGTETHSHHYKVASIVTKMTAVDARAVDYNTDTVKGRTVLKQNQAFNTNSNLGDGSAWNYGDATFYISDGKTGTTSNMPPHLPVYIWKRIK